MGTLNPLWFFMKKSMTVALFGITISDRYATVYSLTGTSMSPTFTTSSPGFPGYLKGDIVLVEKFCLEKYKFSRGDVIAFKLDAWRRMPPDAPCDICEHHVPTSVLGALRVREKALF